MTCSRNASTPRWWTSKVDDPLVKASWAGTALFTMTSVVAVLARPARPVAIAVAVALFVAGVVAMAAALVRAAGRSRTEAVTVPGVFFLTDSAPKGVRRHLLGALAVQAAVAFATAAARPFTTLAFGVLAPVYGLGLTGLWGARHGSFGPRRR
jgi:hypothetical protein